MYDPVGLQAWEVVAASGLCAIAALSVGTLIGAAVAVFVTRERAPVRAKAPVRPAAEPQPAYAAPAAPALVG